MSKDKIVKRSNETKVKNFEKFYEKYEKAAYKIGATGPDAFDCSGFVQRAFKEIYGINLPRTSGSQYMQGTPVRKFSRLKYGDLVFFNTDGKGVSHVGIYLYDKKFLHASTSSGIVISYITMDYYKKRFMEGRRILK
ncbi:MAG: C40 family peptidase [Candidatus Delongbacteria bacterium]|nr:C40 family peptidase [Candidatus Delongbacteria bacterium]MCG2760949.1 NlpC/P60 family protein [Candidatus Delongbacteria bacterium]